MAMKRQRISLQPEIANENNDARISVQPDPGTHEAYAIIRMHYKLKLQGKPGPFKRVYGCCALEL